mgnify:CR=1 FL=1
MVQTSLTPKRPSGCSVTGGFVGLSRLVLSEAESCFGGYSGVEPVGLPEAAVRRVRTHFLQPHEAARAQAREHQQVRFAEAAAARVGRENVVIQDPPMGTGHAVRRPARQELIVTAGRHYRSTVPSA